MRHASRWLSLLLAGSFGVGPAGAEPPRSEVATLPVTRRAPTAADVAGYAAGWSLWIDDADRIWALDGVTAGRATWVPYAAPAAATGALIGRPVLAMGTRRLVGSYAGPLFDVLRMSDRTSIAVGALADGKPDLAALASFLAPTQGYGYVSRFYNQDGSGNDAAQSSIAQMPAVSLEDARGGMIPLRFDYGFRQYWAGMQRYPATWTSGPSMTIPAAALTALIVKYPVLPGMLVTGANIPANTTVVSLDYATGALVLSQAPSAPPGGLLFGAAGEPAVYLSVPPAASVPWQSHTVVAALQAAANTISIRPVIFGVQGGDAPNPAGTWSGLASIGRQFAGLRFLDGGGRGADNGYGPRLHSSPQVLAFSHGPPDGRSLQWVANNTYGAFAAGASVPAAILTGAAIGDHNQWMAPQHGDFLLWDLIATGTTLPQADLRRVAASIYQAHGWKPQIVSGLVADGSSTTFGNGTTSPLSWPTQLTMKLADVFPANAYVSPGGGTIESDTGFLPANLGMLATPNRDLVVFHPGAGNSMQAGGSLAVTATDTATGILTTSGNPQGSFWPGAHITGNANLPRGGRIVANTPTSVTVDAAHRPTGTVATISLMNDQGNWAFEALREYCNAALALGYKRILLIGSASRKTFSAQNLVEFDTLKTYMREAWRSLPGVVAFLDWEDLPQFGDDGGMTVTRISGNRVTVAALSAYAARGNRIRWPGMPYDIAADTGGQTIAGVAGTVITVSGATTGLSVGSIIRAVNPAPWVDHPQYWGTDGQHFSPLGYRMQGDVLGQYMIDHSIMPRRRRRRRSRPRVAVG